MTACRPPLGCGRLNASRLAQTTQAVLAEEALLGRVADPAAGSYYVECLTRDLVRQGWTQAVEIERQGGMKGCLLSGLVEAAVAQSAEARREELASSIEEAGTILEARLRDEESAAMGTVVSEILER